MFTLTIIRGLPGSGKSTTGDAISRYERCNMWEADMFFIDDNGRYVYDPKLIKDAHMWCKTQVEYDLSKGRSVVVCNTFTKVWEIQPYIDLAKRFGAKIQIIECKGQFGNIHNVPQEVLDRMRDRWENVDYGMICRWCGEETEEVSND